MKIVEPLEKETFSDADTFGYPRKRPDKCIHDEIAKTGIERNESSFGKDICGNKEK